MPRSPGHRLSYDMRRRIIACHARGYELDEIAVALDISSITATKWIRRWEQHGMPGLCDVPRYWTPHRFSDALRAAIRLVLDEHPEWSANRAAREVTPLVYPDGNRKVDPVTIKRLRM